MSSSQPARSKPRGVASSRETGKTRLVQKVLGHANLSATMVSTHIFDEEVEDALNLSLSNGGSGVRHRYIRIGDNEIDAGAMKDTS